MKKTELDQKIEDFQDEIEIVRERIRKQKLAKKKKALQKAKQIMAEKEHNVKRLIPEKRWEKLTKELRRRYVTLQNFCDHYSFTEDDFEQTFGLEPNQNAEKILNALLKEEVIKKSDILKYWNAVQPDVARKIKKFKTVLSVNMGAAI